MEDAACGGYKYELVSWGIDIEAPVQKAQCFMEKKYQHNKKAPKKKQFFFPYLDLCKGQKKV